jgi:hypothetical protein
VCARKKLIFSSEWWLYLPLLFFILSAILSYFCLFIGLAAEYLLEFLFDAFTANTVEVPDFDI